MTPAWARRLAENGRNAAEWEFEWREIGGRFADEARQRPGREVR